MFEILKQRYEMNFVRKDQLKQYVKLKAITAQEYQLITNEPYVAA